MYKNIFNNCFSLKININDVFMWGCGDSEDIETEDTKELEPLFKQYGTELVLWAYIAIKRSYGDKFWADALPQKAILEALEKTRKEYQEVREHIVELATDNKILFEENYKKQTSKKEIEKFGEPIIKIQHIKLENFPNYWCILQLKKLEIAGIGRNMAQALEDLEQKFNKIMSK